MLTLFILLGLPVLAGVLLALDHYVRFAASRDELGGLALAMRGVGLALAGMGLAVMLVAAFHGEPVGNASVTNVVMRMGAAACGLLAIMTSVVGHAFRAPRDSTELREESRGDQRASLFRLLCWLLVLLPLFPFIPMAVLVLPVALTMVLSSLGALNRGNQVSLLWRLCIAAENNLPYAEEVETAASGAGSNRRLSLAVLANRLQNGQSLGEALAPQTSLLPRGDVLAIRAAEGTPALAGVLHDSAERSVRSLAELRDGGDALPIQAYVVNVVLVLILIVSFLMYWIIPKFKEIFSDFDMTLPPVTQQLIRISDGAAEYWFILWPLLCIPVGLLLAPPLIALAGWENLNFPLVMRWFPRRDAPEVLRVIAAIVDSGRPLTESLSDIAEHHPREDLRPRLRSVVSQLESGDRSWAALCEEGFLKRREAAALDAAAANDHLAWALRTTADNIASQQRTRTAWLIQWQRPILIGGLGAVVAFICVAMFLPLISIIEQAEMLAP